MNFPLLRTFEVSNLITYFLNQKVVEYKNEYNSWDDVNCFDTNNGYQSTNLLQWEDKDFLEFIRVELSAMVCNQLGVERDRFKYHFIHFLDYKNGGSMNYHKHWHNEDFVLFIYLKDCESGKTIFHLNDYDEDSSDRTLVELTPKKNLGAIFSSLVKHKGENTEEEKRIFVVGIKLNNTY